jgi:hypothetical protein
MSEIISKAALEARKARYQPGTRVELVSMTDPYTNLKPGDRGEVTAVDSLGTVFINWDNGSTLGAAYGADEIKLLPTTMPSEVREQIIAVRATGKSNMFDTKAVFELAMQMGFYELADFIFMNTKTYSHFILTGEEISHDG